MQSSTIAIIGILVLTFGLFSFKAGMLTGIGPVVYETKVFRVSGVVETFLVVFLGAHAATEEITTQIYLGEIIMPAVGFALCLAAFLKTLNEENTGLKMLAIIAVVVALVFFLDIFIPNRKVIPFLIYGE